MDDRKKIMYSKKFREVTPDSFESTDTESDDDNNEVTDPDFLNAAEKLNSSSSESGTGLEGHIKRVSGSETSTTMTTDSDEDNQISDVPSSNPLLVGIVLDNVFQHFSFDLPLLKTCRMVCSSWREAATKYFRKRSICIPMKFFSTTQIESPPQIRKLYSKSNPGVCDPVSDSIYKGFFHQALPPVLPFENIFLTENIKGSKENRVSISDAVVTRWFRTWGSHIKGIRLKLKTFHNKVKTSQFLESVLTQGCVNVEELELLAISNLSFQELNLERGQLAKMKKLIIRDKRASSQSESCKAKVLSQIHTLFAAAPNVESIVVDIDSHDWGEAVAKLIAESFRQLKTLEWCNSLYEKHVHQLEKMSVEVQLRNINLNCKIVPQPGNFASIKRFLSKFSKSLEMFRITGEVVERFADGMESESDSDIDLYDDHPPIGFELFEGDFAGLEKLRVLEIGNIRHCRLAIKTNVLQKFQNLEKLILRRAPSNFYHFVPNWDNFPFYDNQNQPMAVLEPHTNLKELHLEPEIRMRDFVPTLSFVFPNIKILHISVHSERIFAEVFRTMRSLEELHLRFKTTEFPRCNAALSGSLLEMKNLKRLTLEHLGPYSFQLTEHTVVSGLKRAAKLRWIHLVNFAVCVSERNSILEHLKQYVTVKFTNCVIQSPPLNAVYGILSSLNLPNIGPQ